MQRPNCFMIVPRAVSSGSINNLSRGRSATSSRIRRANREAETWPTLSPKGLTLTDEVKPITCTSKHCRAITHYLEEHGRVDNVTAIIGGIPDAPCAEIRRSYP